MTRKLLDLRREEICRLLGIAAMMAWSAVLLWFYASGRIQAYIQPDYLRTACLLGGLGIGILSLFNLWNLRNGTGCGECRHGETEHDCGHASGQESCCGHGHQGHEHEEWDSSYSGNLAMFLVMVVPVLVAAGYSKDRYLSVNTIRNKGFVEDARAVARNVERDLGRRAGGASGVQDAPDQQIKEDTGQYTLADLEKVVDRSVEGNLMLTVDQLFYTAGDAELQRVLDGQAVETVGQVIPYDPKKPHPSRLRVFTLMITCCAADAQPVSIPVEFSGEPPGFEEMSWVKVSGIMRYAKDGGQVVPMLKAKAMVPAEQPYEDAIY